MLIQNILIYLKYNKDIKKRAEGMQLLNESKFDLIENKYFKKNINIFV